MLFPFWTHDEGCMLFAIDKETNSLVPPQNLPTAHYFVPGMRENELLLLSEIGVYSYFLDTGEQEKVFYWLELDMVYPFGAIWPIGEGQFVLLDSTGERHPTSITVLTRTAVEEDTRTVITLSSLQPDFWLIRDFNEQNSDYRIVVLDYSEFAVGSDISAAQTRFNIDIVTGRIPDIIDFSHLDYQVLATGGFLADLNPWFEQDSRKQRSDYFERVFNLLEFDGSLYAVPSAFLIATYFAPASLVGTSPGITLERLMALDEQFNDGHSLLQGASPQAFLEMHWMNSRFELINYNAGSAHFETN